MGLVQTSLSQLVSKCPTKSMWKHMVDGYSIETSQNHFSIGFCWALNSTHMVQNHAHLRSSDAFSAQGGKNMKKHRNVNENDWRAKLHFWRRALMGHGVMPFYPVVDLGVENNVNPKSWSLKRRFPRWKKNSPWGFEMSLFILGFAWIIGWCEYILEGSFLLAADT